MPIRSSDLQRLVLLLLVLIAAMGFTGAGLSIAWGDDLLTMVGLTLAVAALLTFGYRAARTQWIDYS
ncbi:MAG: hypothetical protein AAF842_11705 [Planctomycetota bacterium]